MQSCPLLPPIAGAFAKAIAPPVAPAYFNYGAIRARRREEAILIQQFNIARHNYAGVPWLLRFYDVRNAFPSIDRAPALNRIDALTQWKAECLHTFFENHIAFIPAADKPIFLSLERGFPPGLSVATDFYGYTYNHALHSFIEDPDLKEIQADLWVPPVVGSSTEPICTANTSFVDDLGSFMPVYTNHCALHKATAASSSLDKALETVKLIQNCDKGETICKLRGQGLTSVYRALAAAGTVGLRRTARYLGPQMHADLVANREVEIRLASARKAWYCYRKIWASPVAYEFKKLVYVALVFSNLLSGLICFKLTEKNVEVLSAFHCKCLRRLLKGTACEKELLDDGATRFRSIPNHLLYQHVHIPSVSTELLLQRLKFLQGVTKEPEHHAQFWTALLSPYKFEQDGDFEKNPFYLHIVYDLDALRLFEDVDWLPDAVGKYVKQAHHLPRNKRSLHPDRRVLHPQPRVRWSHHCQDHHPVHACHQDLHLQ